MLKRLISPAWAMLEYGWYPLLLFLATPWFLSQLGTELYGHWMLLNATLGFGGVMNVGTGAATIKGISAGIGRGKSEDVEKTVNASLGIALFGGGTLAVLVFSIYWFAGSSLFGKMGEAEILRLTGITAAVALWLEQLDNVFSSAIKGAEQFGPAARVEIASRTTQVIAAAFVLLVSSELWALYITLVLVAVLRLAAKVIVARRLLNIRRVRPNLRNARLVVHFAKWGWLQGVGGLMFNAADRMLIGSLLGATSLTYYAIASQLAMQVHALSSAGLSVIFPRVSRMIERQGVYSLRRLARLTTSANFLLSTSLALVLFVAGPEILRIWVGVDTGRETAKLLPWLVAAYWILALNTVFYYMLLGLGKIRFVGLTVLGSGAVAISASYFAISGFGLIGAPAGRGVYAILSLALIWPLIRHMRSDSESDDGLTSISNNRSEGDRTL